MLDPEPIIQRFAMRTYLKDKVGTKGVSPVKVSSRLLTHLMMGMIPFHPTNSQEDWARDFLISLLNASKNYRLLQLSHPFRSYLDSYFIYWKLCQELLFNYCQPICWKVSLKLNRHFQASPKILFQYPVEECFLIGSVFIYQPQKLFKGFNLKSPSSLDGYAYNTLKRMIRNQIAQELKLKSLKFSDQGLLRTIDKKILEKALRQYGITASDIILYCLACQCFKELFESIYPTQKSDGSRGKVPSKITLDTQQLNQLAQRFNQQAKRLELDSSRVNGIDIQRMLDMCIKAIRNHKNIRSVSLEAQVNSDVAGVTSNPIESVIEKEKESELYQFKQLIIKAFNTLEQTERNCLLLWLGLGINQKDFLEILQLDKQYQVARKFQSCQKDILKNIISETLPEEIKQNLSQKDINQIVKQNLEQIKDYLDNYSQSFFNQILDKILTQQMNKNECTILIANLDIIKDKPTVEESEVSITKDKLIKLFTETIEQKLQISLKEFNSYQKSILQFITYYLQDNLALFLAKTSER